jgi:hypothetical protein
VSCCGLSDHIIITFYSIAYLLRDRDSSVGIATGYRLDGPGIESRWGRDFSHTSRPDLGTGSFPGIKRPGRGDDHPNLLAPGSRKSIARPLPPSGPSGLLRSTITFYPSSAHPGS